jgi:hypothetical protein
MKKLVRLTETDLHRIIKESVKKVLRENEITGEHGEDMYNDTTTSVYHSCRPEFAQKIIDLVNSGNADKLVARGKGNAYGDGIYATLKPDTRGMYGGAIVEFLVPGSAIKPIFTKRDGGFCVLNPNDIYSARMYGDL